MTPIRCASAALVMLVVPWTLTAQAAGGLPSFLEELGAAGHRFENLSVAVAEGYRKLGPDFPGMGEHWVNPGLVIAGELDPARPPVLGYTFVDGDRRLVSFAYTRVLGPGEVPPAGPFPAHAWHDHTGGVDEESLLLSGPMSMDGEDNGFRLSMVHVWLGVENPDGVLAQNNWALPYLRAGVPAPERPSSEAARALALSSEEGMAFYEELLREGVGLEGRELDVAVAAFEEAGRESRLRLEDPRTSGGLGETSVDDLEAVWAHLWARLEKTLSSGSVAAMAPLRS